MSLSWLDRLTLQVHPRRLVLTHRPWHQAPHHSECPVPAPGPGETVETALLAALGPLLAAGARRGARLDIVLADAFVRYALVPWGPGAVGRGDRLAVARALLRHALGERADTLAVTVEPPAFGRNGLAAGVEQALVDGLRAAARTHGLRLGSLRPRLVVELNRCRAEVDDAWLACVEEDWLSLVGVARGDIACLRNHRAESAAVDSLAGELAGLLAAEGARVPGRRLVIAGRHATWPAMAAGWEVIPRPTLEPGNA